MAWVVKSTVFLSLLSSVAVAEVPKENVDIFITANELRVSVKSGYHLNEAAPNSLNVDGQTRKPESKKSDRIFFSLPGGFKLAKASIYICDDDLTFCEPKRFEFGPDRKIRGSDLGALKGPAQSQKRSGVVKQDVLGFIDDDLPAAMALAKKGKRLLLLDFAANWCPPCQALQTEVFPSREFQKASSQFVKVRIDCDKFENQFLKKKYNLQGIPTIVVTDSEGEEIMRLLDSAEPVKVAVFLDAASAQPIPIKTLLKKISEKADDSMANAILGERLFHSGRFQESVLCGRRQSTTALAVGE